MDPNHPAGGYQTRFTGGERARVTKDGDRMKVGKTDSDHTQSWDPIPEVRRIVDGMVIDLLAEIGMREGLEPEVDAHVEELRHEPEYRDTDAFTAHKLENDEFTYGFADLQALARNAAQRRTGDPRTATASEQDIKAIRQALEADVGFKYVAREPVKRTRGHLSNAHGTHPFAGAGGGGSGFGSDFGGTSFTSFGGGPGAVGGDYAWDPNDPKNLSMGTKRKKA
jgi:hypothetical protein